MWLTIIGTIIFCYIIYQFDKRLQKVEEVKGQGFSHWFSVNVQEAVLNHKKFGELTGIKSSSAGKEYKDWSKEDKEKWGKINSKMAEQIDKSRVTLTYLASENAYFVNNFNDNPSIVFRKEYRNKLLYSAVVVGDEDGFEPNIEFSLYERLIKRDKGNYEWLLVPCLEYQDGKIGGEREFTILCEFPHFKQNQTDDDLKQLGFEIKRCGGDDVYTDSFGDMDGIPTEIKYIKNGAEIRYIY